MAQRFTRIGTVLLLFGTLAVAGGGGDAQSAATPAITKKEWVHRAFDICKRLGHEQQRGHYAFERAHGMDTSEPGQREREQINTVFVLPFVERKIDELRALAVPAGEQAKIAAILKAMEEGIRVSRAHPEWLAAPSAAHPDPFTKATELAAANGIWDCGQA